MRKLPLAAAMLLAASTADACGLFGQPPCFQPNQFQLVAPSPPPYAGTTTMNTIGGTTFVNRPGYPTTTLNNIGGSTFINTRGQPTRVCNHIGLTTFCNSRLQSLLCCASARTTCTWNGVCRHSHVPLYISESARALCRVKSRFPRGGVPHPAQLPVLIARLFELAKAGQRRAACQGPDGHGVGTESTTERRRVAEDHGRCSAGSGLAARRGAAHVAV
jgi:hypothetical protein